MIFDYALIEHYFPELSKQQIQQYQSLREQYILWNSRINLISRKDIDHLYLHHILHSLSIAKVIQFKPGTKILDFGTGGGLPGIPLAIMFPQTRFHLVDSIKKKIMVVGEICTSLEIKNVVSEQARVEGLFPTYDFAIGRAVTRLEVILNWLAGKINKESHHNIRNGLLYLKGNESSDLKLLTDNQAKIYPLKNYFDEDFFKTKLLIHFASRFSFAQKK